MRWGVLLLAGVLGVSLCGCEATGLLPYARELEDMTLLRTLGVDAGAADGVRVTASSGVQAGGRQGGSQPPVVVTGEGASISAACLAMQSESYLFFGHVGQLLLGEELAGERMEEALDYVLRDVEMRLDTELFVVKGDTAGAAIEGAAGETDSAADRLEAMEESAEVRSVAVRRTVGEVLGDLGRNGCSFAPAVTGSAGLETAGYAVWKDGGLAGWMTGGEAAGVNLLLGRVEADVVEVEAGGLSAALRVVGAKTTVTPLFEGKKLTGLALHCRVDTNLAEAEEGLNLRERKTLETCTQALEAVERARIEAALETAQTLGADFLDLEKRAGLAAPWRWAELQQQWDFAALPITVTVEGRILRSYDVER